ncbi:MAG TPA: hypothetical protein ENK96_08315 [Desulfobulbaceae bacterium]|nr:hypothetical protein [Desulfobulbaceae bacterium]
MGKAESPNLFIEAAGIAYMLGQWTHDPGTSVKAIRSRDRLAPISIDTSLKEEDIHRHNIILLGKKNAYYRKIRSRLTGKGSFIQVVEDGLANGRDTLFVSDSKAGFYLANRRLFFKSGAYRGFFSFVKLGALIMKGDFDAALFDLDDPQAVRSCGKPVILAMGMGSSVPVEMLAVAKKRNRIVFKDLRSALKSGDKELALTTWKGAMETCYACHQGTADVKKYRKFVPLGEEHGYHQHIAEQFGLECSQCHSGTRSIVGYGN